MCGYQIFSYRFSTLLLSFLVSYTVSFPTNLLFAGIVVSFSSYLLCYTAELKLAKAIRLYEARNLRIRLM